MKSVKFTFYASAVLISAAWYTSCHFYPANTFLRSINIRKSNSSTTSESTHLNQNKSHVASVLFTTVQHGSINIDVKKTINGNSNVVVFVLSRRQAIISRNDVRRQYGKISGSIYFVLGSCCRIPPSDRVPFTCSRSKRSTTDSWDIKCQEEDKFLQEEQKLSKDIIFMKEIDVSNNIPYKILFAYEWGLHNTKAKWFLSTTDELIPQMKLLLKTVIGYDANRYTVFGSYKNKNAVIKKGNENEDVILVHVVVHVHKYTKYLAWKSHALESTALVEPCVSGRKVKFKFIYFAYKCVECPSSLVVLTADDALSRSLQMLTHSNPPADFVFKADDDTWVNMPALAKRVCRLDQNEHYFGGFLLKAEGVQFASGGAGYMLSAKTLRDSILTNRCKPHKYEDVGLAKCLKSQLGLTPVHLDVNPDTPEKMVEWAKRPSSDHVSRATFVDPVSYHYIDPDRMSKFTWKAGTRFPKRIHQFFIGGKTPPYEYLKSCSDLHPDWEYYLWTEETLKDLSYSSKYQKNGPYVWGLFAPGGGHNGLLRKVDSLKLEILYRFGGIVMDADQQCIKRLDPILEYGKHADYLGVMEHDHPHAGRIKHLVSNGVQASHQYSQTVFNVIKRIELLRGGSAWQTTGPCLVSQQIKYHGQENSTESKAVLKLCGGSVLKEKRPPHNNSPPIVIVPSDFFYPYHHSEVRLIPKCAHNVSRSYTIQHWSSTHDSYKGSGKPFEHGKSFVISNDYTRYEGSVSEGACKNGIRAAKVGHATIVTYRLIFLLPPGSTIILSKQATIALDGVSIAARCKQCKISRAVKSTIKVTGAEVVRILFETKFGIEQTWPISPNIVSRNVGQYVVENKEKWHSHPSKHFLELWLQESPISPKLNWVFMQHQGS